MIAKDSEAAQKKCVIDKIASRVCGIGRVWGDLLFPFRVSPGPLFLNRRDLSAEHAFGKTFRTICSLSVTRRRSNRFWYRQLKSDRPSLSR